MLYITVYVVVYVVYVMCMLALLYAPFLHSRVEDGPAFGGTGTPPGIRRSDRVFSHDDEAWAKRVPGQLSPPRPLQQQRGCNLINTSHLLVALRWVGATWATQLIIATDR